MEQLGLTDVHQFEWPAPKVIHTMSGWRVELRCKLVQTDDQLEEARELYRSCADITYDSETSGLNPFLGARIAGHALAAVTEPNVVTATYIPVRHIGGENEPQVQLAPERVATALRDVMADGGRCGFHHAKFDRSMLLSDGVEVQRDYEDVSIDANIDDENQFSFALKSLAARFCVETARDEEKSLADWMRSDARRLGIPYSSRRRSDGLETVQEPTYLERFGYARTPINLCGQYACHDVFYTLYLWLVKYKHVKQMWPQLWEREHRVGTILQKMERTGLPADGQLIRDAHDRAREEVQYWLGECKRLSGESQFTGTDAQLRKLFYEKLRMRKVRFTKGSKKKQGPKTPSVDKTARKILQKMYPQHADLLEATMKYSRAQKLYGTYTGSFLRFLADDGRIRPSYNQLERKDKGMPVTGRLSSADPNIQNVDSHPLHLHTCECPKCLGASEVEARELEGSSLFAPNIIEVHRYFTVPEGFIRFYIDFSQIELRVLAWLCQDPVLLHCYQNGLDVHQIIADQLNIERKIAKQVNFGNSYGMTKVGLALRLPGYYDDPDGTEAFAEQVLRSYFQKYTRILQFRDQFAAQMRANRCMFVSPFGRPRRIPTIASRAQWERSRAERMMMSSIVSGTAADIMKESAIRCDDLLVQRNDGSEMVQSIHDELVFDVPKQAGWAGLLVQLVQRMEDWPQFSHPADGRQGVPIKVNASLTTTTWADKREVEIVNGALAWAA